MDDKNNEIIDFSNQPLGLMAQEGAKIEDNLNNEYRLNEAKKNDAGSQDNPFADVTFGKPAETKPSAVPAIANKPTPQIETPKAETPQPTPPQETVQQPVNNTQPSEPVKVEEPKVESTNPEEARKQQIMDELNKVKNKPETTEEQPPSWGIFVFLILIAVVGGAIFLFKSGKLDSFLNEQDEEETQVEKAPSDEKPAEVTPVSTEPEPVRNYHIKQTVYLAMNDTITTTSIGVVDLESNVGKFISTASYNGLTTHNVDEYCDYNAGYCYLQDFNDKNKWT